jgi:nucleoid-associated protein YgaU
VPASVLFAACSAALIFGINREGKLDTGNVTATTRPSQSAPSVSNKESSSALAMTEPEALTAKLAELPSVVAADQSVPSFDIARIEGADAVIAGRAAPGAIVDLLHDGEHLDRAVADASGQFVMVPPRLPPGSYELMLSARLPDGTAALSKKGVKVTVNDVGLSSGVAQSRAEYIPESAYRTRAPLEPALRAENSKKSAALKPAQATPRGSAEQQDVSSPAVVPRNLTKVVTRGDSLWRISRITYGDGTRYVLVHRANRDRIRNPNLIHPGQILSLPMERR